MTQEQYKNLNATSFICKQDHICRVFNHTRTGVLVEIVSSPNKLRNGLTMLVEKESALSDWQLKEDYLKK